MPKRSVVKVGIHFARHVVPAAVKPMRTLWHEIIGFLFLALAAWAVPSGIRAVREFDGDPGDFVKLIVIGVFMVIMAWYGLSSFRRARRISRS